MTRPRWGNIDRPVTPEGWSWSGATLVPQGPRRYPHGRIPQSEAEEILSDAVAWWDVERSGFRDGDRWLRNLGTAGGVLDLRLGSSLLANSNDPLLVAPDAQAGYVFLPGIFQNHLTVPDAAVLRVTGDIDVRVKMSTDSHTSTGHIFTKHALNAVSYGWSLQQGADGKLTFAWSTTGTNIFGATSTVSLATALPVGTVGWVRATLDVDNGASGNTVAFYTSSDDGATWTQLGDPITAAGTTSIYATTLRVTVGADADDGFRYATSWRFYRAQLRDGIDGTLVLDVDCDVLTSGSATSFKEQSANAATVTINRYTSGRKAVGMPSRSKGGRACLLHGSDDYMQAVNAQQRGLFSIPGGESVSILASVRRWATPVSNSQILTTASGNGGDGTFGLGNDGTSDRCLFGFSDGLTTVFGQALVATYTYGSQETIVGVMNRTSNQARLHRNNDAPATLAVTERQRIRNIGNLHVGRFAPPNAQYADMEFRAAAIWRRPLTTREITVLANSGMWGT